MKRVSYALIVLLLVLTAVGVLVYREADWTVYLWQRGTIEERLPDGAWVVRTAYPWWWTTELMFTKIPVFERRKTCDEKAAYLKSILTPAGGPPVAGGKIVDPETFQVTAEYSADPYHSAPWTMRTTWQLACGRHAPDSWFRWFPALPRTIQPQNPRDQGARGSTGEYDGVRLEGG